MRSGTPRDHFDGGYGDQYPVTNLGRLCAAVIIVVGVGIFGTFTGYLATVSSAEEHGCPAGGRDRDGRAESTTPARPVGTCEELRQTR